MALGALAFATISGTMKSSAEIFRLNNVCIGHFFAGARLVIGGALLICTALLGPLGPEVAGANEVSRSYALENPVGFSSLDEAAIAALRAAAAMSNVYENGGCLYEKDGKFYFTQPVGQNSENEFSATCEMPRSSFRGIFHTHPTNVDGRGFSGVDVATATQLNVTSYVALLDSDAVPVLRFVPGQTRVHCAASSGTLCSSRARRSVGELIGGLSR